MVTGWIEKPLGELFNFSGGVSASRAQLSDIGFLYLHYGDIHGTTRTFIDVCADNTIPRLNISLNKISNASLLQDGDVVFVDASEDDEGASRHIVVRNAENRSFISGLHTIVAKPKSDELDNRYREHCFQTASIKAQFKFYAVGTKVVGVNKSTIKDINLCFPVDIKEQRRIAAALSDTDEYITALEKLIAKKRAVKQGAMQELLTGKRRLPGFDGEWVEKRICNIGYPYSGLTGKRKEHFGHGDAKYITFLNVLMNTVIDTGILESVDVSANENQNAVQCGDLFFNTSSETPEEVGMCAILTQPLKNTYLNSFCFGFRLSDDEIDGLFMSYYFNSNEGRRIMTLLAQGATRYNLPKTYFNDTVLTIPEKTEQTAIAAILSDMDAEIDALTAKLKKMRNIKQGMMCELLTGRIRLKNEEGFRDG
jgi:type I restriction enzyme S subunit